jgi:probable F420-dependent oxidoreductase
VRFSYSESMCDPSFYLPLARAAEEVGFTSMVVPDSIFYPEHSDSKYPYTPDGNREFLADKPFLEPFSIIPAMGAVTTKLRFTSFVMKLPIRDPVLAAKSASSVAVITGNRFGFGIGLSPWPEDYRVCSQEWKGRGARMDEMIAILRGLTKGEFFEFHGKYYDIERIKLCPGASEPIPLLIGGHSEAALRRAAFLCDGWMHAGGDEDELVRILARLAELRKEAGRQDEPFEIHAISLDGYTPDGVRRLEDLGVTDLIVAFRNLYEEDSETLETKIEALQGYAETVISKA